MSGTTINEQDETVYYRLEKAEQEPRGDVKDSKETTSYSQDVAENGVLTLTPESNDADVQISSPTVSSEQMDRSPKTYIHSD